MDESALSKISKYKYGKDKYYFPRMTEFCRSLDISHAMFLKVTKEKNIIYEQINSGRSVSFFISEKELEKIYDTVNQKELKYTSKIPFLYTSIHNKAPYNLRQFDVNSNDALTEKFKKIDINSIVEDFFSDWPVHISNGIPYIIVEKNEVFNVGIKGNFNTTAKILNESNVKNINFMPVIMDIYCLENVVHNLASIRAGNRFIFPDVQSKVRIDSVPLTESGHVIGLWKHNHDGEDYAVAPSITELTYHYNRGRAKINEKLENIDGIKYFGNAIFIPLEEFFRFNVSLIKK